MRKTFISIFIFLIFSSVLLGLASNALADPIKLNLNYPQFPNGPDLTTEQGQQLPALIAYFYYMAIGIAGFLAFIMIVWGGVQWLVSAGNPTQISEAKDRIKSALLGVVLILASFIILQIINPDLTVLKIGDTK